MTDHPSHAKEILPLSVKPNKGVLKTIFILCLSFQCILSSYAQDPHFSQFFASPLTLNPANTGNFNGSMRVAGNYRNQWPSFGNAFISSTASIDGPIFADIIPERDKLSVGLLLLSDQSGNGILKENYAAVSLSYTKGLDEDAYHSLTAGFQASVGNLRFDESKANFEDELSASGFTLPSNELWLSGSLGKTIADMHAGLLYKGTINDENLIYLGASVYHLKQPSVGFSSNTVLVRNRFNVHAGTLFVLGNLTTLHTSVQFQDQFNYREIVIGGALSQLLLDNKKNYAELFAGAWIRNNDAFIPYLGLEWNSLRAGFSYDISYSKRKASAALYQSAEFSLNWIFYRGEGRPAVNCPKF